MSRMKTIHFSQAAMAVFREGESASARVNQILERYQMMINGDALALIPKGQEAAFIAAVRALRKQPMQGYRETLVRALRNTFAQSAADAVEKMDNRELVDAIEAAEARCAEQDRITAAAHWDDTMPSAHVS